jgi:hypothetical protein
MSLALDDLPRGPDRPLYDLPPMTEVITWQKASLVSAQGKHDTFRKYLDATHAAIGKLRLMIRWLPPRQFGRRLERLTSYTVSNVLCRKHFEPLLYFHVGEVVLVSKPVMAPHHHG